jgi:DNA-directed RNA polymerase subunit RPC12/RpoP
MRFWTERRIKHVRQSPREYLSAGLVHNSGKITEPLIGRNYSSRYYKIEVLKMSPYLQPPGIRHRVYKCSSCGKKIANVIPDSSVLGIPDQKCRKCGTIIHVTEYKRWDEISSGQKVWEIFSCLIVSIVAGILFGGIIGSIFAIFILFFSNNLVLTFTPAIISAIFFFGLQWFKLIKKIRG